MDAQAWVALATLTFGVILSLIGMAVYLLAKIETVREISHKKSDDLHERINGIKDDYVRRDDLESHLKPLKDLLAELHQDIKRLAMQGRA